MNFSRNDPFKKCDECLEESLSFIDAHQSYLHRLRLKRDCLVEQMTRLMIDLDEISDRDLKNTRKKYIIAIQNTIERLEDLFTTTIKTLQLTS